LSCLRHPGCLPCAHTRTRPQSCLVRSILEFMQSIASSVPSYSGFHSDVWHMCMGSVCPPTKSDNARLPFMLPRTRMTNGLKTLICWHAILSVHVGKDQCRPVCDESLLLTLLWFAGIPDADDGALILLGEACQRDQEPLEALALRVAHSSCERPNHTCAPDWGSDPCSCSTTADHSRGDPNSGPERP
jgi:hypothetical protein